MKIEAENKQGRIERLLTNDHYSIEVMEDRAASWITRAFQKLPNMIVPWFSFVSDVNDIDAFWLKKIKDDRNGEVIESKFFDENV